VLVATAAVCAFAVVDAAVEVKAQGNNTCGGYGLSCPPAWECCGNASSIASSCYNPRDSQCCGAATSDFVCPASRECCVSDDGQRKSCCAPGNCTGDGTCGTPSPPFTSRPMPPIPPPATPAPCVMCQGRCLPEGGSCCFDGTLYCPKGETCCGYANEQTKCCPDSGEFGCQYLTGKCRGADRVRP